MYSNCNKRCVHNLMAEVGRREDADAPTHAVSLCGLKFLRLSRALVARRAVQKYTRKQRRRAKRNRFATVNFENLPCCSETLTLEEVCASLEVQVDRQNVHLWNLAHGQEEEKRQLAAYLRALRSEAVRQAAVQPSEESADESLAAQEERLTRRLEELRGEMRSKLTLLQQEKQRASEALRERDQLQALLADARRH
eukprot:TRINITY_DN32346_c0_g2_i4.p1 TRINITY_DN32346_c0_g2~~TRINITY_DN32346_c0_g2_i4.p1  ORF type:complete len:205 (-),score=42.20 TRINITY_DN32346_c0_g2_i4:92-679(-)